MSLDQYEILHIAKAGFQFGLPKREGLQAVASEVFHRMQVDTNRSAECSCTAAQLTA